MSKKQTGNSLLVLSYLVRSNDIQIVLIRSKEKPKPVNGKSLWEQPMWRLPGGHIEKNESPIEAAAREYNAKTGLIVRNLQQIQIIEKKPKVKAFAKHFQYCFIGETSTPSNWLRENNEKLVVIVKVCTLGDIIACIKNGTLLHGHAILPPHRQAITQIIGAKLF